MEEDEKMLYNQKFEGNEAFGDDKMESLAVQKSNSRIPLVGIPTYVWLYQLGMQWYSPEKIRKKKQRKIQKYENKLEKVDSSKVSKINKYTNKIQKIESKYEKKLEEGNFLMRIGEEVVVYDSSQAKRTTGKIEQFYFSKGFFYTKVNFSTKYRLWRATVTYTIDEGEPYIVDSLHLATPDSNMYRLIKNSEVKPRLTEGTRYDQEKINNERDRIANILKNNGYFAFSPQYITFWADTTYKDKKVAMRIIVNSPENQKEHRQYRLDSIVFISDSNIQGRGAKREYTYYDGITFGYYNDNYNKKILSQRVAIMKDSLYSRQSTLNTQQQLANMDIFKFVNINYDTTGDQFVANIFASPLSKYTTSNELGVTVTQGFPGPFYNLSLKNRNVFGGLEILELNGRAGIEGVASASDFDEVYRSSEIRGNLGLTFPQFLLPLNDKTKRRLGQINPRTRLEAGYIRIDRPEYRRNATNFNWSYNWRNQNNTQFSFTPIDISLINSTFKDEDFRQQLEIGGNIINSFNPSFVSSGNLAVTFNFGRYGLYEQKSAYLRTAFETGGTVLNFVDTDIFAENGLEYYKYLKFSADFRRFLPLAFGNVFAYRFRAGVSVPYGSNAILPYEEYFFAGGSNSIRAWRPRRLGPGSYAANEDPNQVTQLEQPGEIVFESSLEFRRNLVGFIDGALFVDLGNVWTINEDESRPGAQFKWTDFYREIAVGTGFGLRFDFTFLIIRLDLAAKVLDPARKPGERFVLDDLDLSFLQNNNNYAPLINIGIGYPF